MYIFSLGWHLTMILLPFGVQCTHFVRIHFVNIQIICYLCDFIAAATYTHTDIIWHIVFINFYLRFFHFSIFFVLFHKYMHTAYFVSNLCALCTLFLLFSKIDHSLLLVCCSRMHKFHPIIICNTIEFYVRQYHHDDKTYALCHERRTMKTIIVFLLLNNNNSNN